VNAAAALSSGISAAILLSFCVDGMAVNATSATQPADDVRAQVDAGKQVFATNCIVCHGAAGAGARAPSLANRDLPLDVIRTTILNGRAGTPMPPFKDALDAKAQRQIMAYVLWLASNGRMPSAVLTNSPADNCTRETPQPSIPSPQPVAIGSERGTPSLGAAIFFDSTKMYSCHSCHSYSKKGGQIGPDFIDTDTTPLQIYESISRPKVASPDYPAVVITKRDGVRVAGIKSDEGGDVWRVFDVSSVPPVLRTILKSDVIEVSAVKDAGIYDHTGLPYSKQDLLDVSAFLGKMVLPTTRKDMSR